ncbi:MarR family winged helix-turn-helix transcriptional regulator [Amycolatopsis samaneae]|uniref:MarR family winged helix-turn-helix transcriptional regulator n=1 Tax=Amycolatopsis samaneae TaxID=664691 RepID=A0ABW5GS07_9PSEU
MPPTRDDHDLTDALLRLSCVLEGIKGELCKGLGLTSQQAQLLTMVETGERTHGELASLLYCDKTNVTGLVDRLERRGLVRREPDARDRRVLRVFLTERGREVVTRFRDAVGTAVADHLGSWPADRRGELAGFARAAAETLRG